MMQFVKSLKYHWMVSLVARSLLWPVIKLGKIAKWLELRLKINGGRAQYFGVSLIFPKNVGVNILSNLYWNGDQGHEPLMGRGIFHACQSADSFFDIGSNFGFYSVWVQRLCTGIRSYCFEPVDHLFEDNNHFHQANGATRMEIHNYALGSAEGKATIMIPIKRSARFLITSATLSEQFARHKGFQTQRKEIRVGTLDSFVEKQPEASRDRFRRTVLKIDVEGFEADVLWGGLKFFGTFKPIAFVEVFLEKKNIESIVAFLSEVDYTAFALVAQGLARMTPSDLEHYAGDRNFVLLPRTRLEGAGLRNLIPYEALQALL